MTEPHIPVLLAEVLNVLALTPNAPAIDATAGAGGHSKAILTRTAPNGPLLALDVDPSTHAPLKERLAPFGPRLTLVEANFGQVAQVAQQINFPPPQGILADLGVSSMQLNRGERGFSFQQDGPLDMRMGPSATTSAETLVNTLPESDLADLIYRYGEERKSRRIARAIAHARPLDSTLALAQVVEKAAGGRRNSHLHPATRTFQALRIATNDELGNLERFLPQAIQLLAPGGRLAVISFHSLEDRLVKHYFQRESQDCLCPPQQLICTCQHQASVKIITKKPLTAAADEIDTNPRARSAKLRVAEKLAL